MNKLITPAILGGLALFVWSSVSWMVLPFHNQSFKSFGNEGIVIGAMSLGDRGSGVYLLPQPKHGDGHDGRKEPFAFVVYNKTGWGDMNFKMGLALAVDMLSAYFAAWLLLLAGVKGFVKKVFFLESLGIFAGLVVVVPNAIWWGYSDVFTFTALADLVIGWCLAGIVIAKFTK